MELTANHKCVQNAKQHKLCNKLAESFFVESQYSSDEQKTDTEYETDSDETKIDTEDEDDNNDDYNVGYNQVP